MEIGSGPNSPNQTNTFSSINTNNNNNLTTNTNRNASDDENNQNSASNRIDLFDHPPSKKLLTVNNSKHLIETNQKTLGLNNKNKNDKTEDDDEDIKMDSSNTDSVTNKNSPDMALDTSLRASASSNPSIDLIDNENIDDESRAECTFQLVIDDFQKFKDNKESRLSPQPCIVRNLPWKILAMSKQANNREFALGFFLQCNAESESTRWSVCAVAELRLIHQTDPEKNFVKKIQHLFYLKENDWGFSPFITMKEIMDPEKGFYNIKTDSVTLEVWLNADAPHGTAWDSKKLTGFVGLTNQGATCYMNSLLQTLYFTNELRKAVYLLPTENDDSIKSVPFGLQRTFYDLQFSEKSVGTKKLTRSFGWETLDTFMQHDVQELCRVLMDNIENKMKHTQVEGTIPRLFEGKMISYVKCKVIDYESRRTEGFYDIQLNIKGKKDIVDSFKDYISVESLDGENKYDAGKYGLQEAQKGVFFDSFPPVLHLHLMRFQYDPQTDSNIKINDRYEFYEHIDLSDYLEKPEATPSKYTLHAVLVHSGDNHGGHYVVFINPKLDGKWFKFDDEVVSRCTKKDAINNNFGGNSSEDMTLRHSTNAYMLVYVRDSCKDVVLKDVKRNDIPQVLQDRLIEEKKLELIRKKERTEAHLFMQLNIILEKEFYYNLGNSDLYDVSKVEATKQLKVKKSNTMNEIMKQIAEAYNFPPDEIRMWPIMNRYNNTVRPLNCIDMREVGNKNIQEVSKQDSSWLVFLETSRDLSFSSTFDFSMLIDNTEELLHQHEIRAQEQMNQVLPSYNSKEDVMLFFKFYDPKTTTLRYVFRLHLAMTSTLNALQDKINKKMKFPFNTELLFYEEVKITQITPLTNRDIALEQLAHEQLLDGDIYVFQINEKEKLQSYKCPLVIDYFTNLCLQVEILFCDKNVPNDEGFTQLLSLKMKYEEFAKLVGMHLKHDHLKLQFLRTTNAYDLKAPVGQPIKFNPEFQLKDAFNLNTKLPVRKLFYSKLNINIMELDERRQFKLTWLSSNLKSERELILMPHKKSNVRDLLAECRMELLKEEIITKEQFDNDVEFKLRLEEIVGSKIHRIFKDETLIETLDSQQANKIYRAEQILADEVVTSNEDYLLPVAHFSKEIYATFGSPFLLKIKLGEPFKDIKQRIQRRLEVQDKEFSTYRFAVITMGTANYITDDENSLFDLSGPSGFQPWLGIDHANKNANKSKNRYPNMEKAIKIFN